MRQVFLFVGIAIVFAASCCAQDQAELLNRMKAMEERIKALEQEVQTLKAAPPPAAPVPAPAPPPAEAAPSQPAAAAAPAPEPQLGGAGGAAAKVLNPDISVIGDFLGAAGNGANRPTPSLEMHESEVGLQAILDPYARADFFISFGEHSVDLEEGYLTFTALPAGLQLRVGKMRAAFGKVNTLHNHVLPWTDRPLVTQNLVAGEDGINDAGFSLSRILPAPKGIFLEGTAQVFRGDTEGLFRAERRRNVSTVEHLHAYRDITESTNVDLGASYARGHSATGAGSTELYGADATVRWKPLRRAIYNSFVARSEFIWARAHVDPSEVILNAGGPIGPVAIANPLAPYLAKPFGFYVSGDYQLNRRWFVGARFDRSERLTSSLIRDTGGSFIVTYWPSEFSQIRGQFRRTAYGENVTANEFLFQFQFSIGAHGAHPF